MKSRALPMKRIPLFCLALIAGAVARAAAPAGDADIVLYNGKVLSVDANDTVYEALAIKGERILAVGSSKDMQALAGRGARRIDLKGKTVTPGLMDTHLHMGMATGEVLSIDLGYPKAQSMADVQRLVRERVSGTPKGAWIQGWGWDEGKLAEHRYIYAKDLDPVSPDNPVFLSHTMGHYVVANTAALKLAGITRDTPDPPGGTIDRGPDGEPTGVLKEYANRLVSSLIPDYTQQQIEDSVAKVLQRGTRECLTGFKDPGAGDPAWNAYHNLAKAGKLPVRVAMLWRSPNDLKEAQALIDKIKPISRPGVPTTDDHIASVGIKIGLDGSGGARTAWMYEDWSKDYTGVDEGNKGYSTIGVATASSLVRMYHEAGIHMGIHSIGDKGIDWTVNAFEQLLKEKPTKGLRHAIIHANVPTDAAIEKMAMLQRKYDAGYPEAQAPFLWWIGDTYSGNLGPLRSLRLKPFRTYLEKGVIWAGGSDYPVTPFEPRYGLWASVARETLLGVNGKTPFGTAESVDIHTALRSYTDWASRQMFMEKAIGTIEPGKLADLAVWDKDMYEIPTAEIKDMKCMMTVFDGKIVHEAK
jgi:predicted amidohydrolase YtcJ